MTSEKLRRAEGAAPKTMKSSDKVVLRVTMSKQYYIQMTRKFLL